MIRVGLQDSVGANRPGKDFRPHDITSGARQGQDLQIALARVTACGMVILLHVAAGNFGQFSPRWWPTNFFDSLVRPSVPLFMMISGALLLPKTEPLGEFALKRGRLALPLLFWSVFYLVWPIWGETQGGNWPLRIITGPVAVHLWYLYALVGLYALVPILRPVYRHSDIAVKFYVIIMWFSISSLLPMCQNFLGFPSNIAYTYGLTTFSGYFGYFFVGAVLYEHRAQLREVFRFSFLIMAFLAASGATMYLTYEYSIIVGSPNELFYQYLSPNVIFAAVAGFQIFLRIPVRDRGAVPGLITFMAECSLGIYCIHQEVLYRFFLLTGLSGGTGSPWWSIPFVTSCVFVISLVVVALMRKVPVLRLAT